MVVFLGFGCFIPHDIVSPPPSLYIDLFISFNLLFVKDFLMVVKLLPTLPGEMNPRRPQD